MCERTRRMCCWVLMETEQRRSEGQPPISLNDDGALKTAPLQSFFLAKP